MVATGEGKDRRATIREPLLMPRYQDIPDWVAMPGWQGPAVEKRRAAAADYPTGGEHRRPRGIEGAPPGLGLMRAGRGDPVMGRRAGAGMRTPGGRATVKGAGTRGGAGGGA